MPLLDYVRGWRNGQNDLFQAAFEYLYRENMGKAIGTLTRMYGPSRMYDPSKELKDCAHWAFYAAIEEVHLVLCDPEDEIGCHLFERTEKTKEVDRFDEPVPIYQCVVTGRELSLRRRLSCHEFDELMNGEEDFLAWFWTILKRRLLDSMKGKDPTVPDDDDVIIPLIPSRTPHVLDQLVTEEQLQEFVDELEKVKQALLDMRRRALADVVSRFIHYVDIRDQIDICQRWLYVRQDLKIKPAPAYTRRYQLGIVLPGIEIAEEYRHKVYQYLVGGGDPLQQSCKPGVCRDDDVKEYS